MFTVSIVLYHPRWQEEILPLLEVLLAIHGVEHIYLIDNSPADTGSMLPTDSRVSYQHADRNLGYGTGHNIALRETKAPYHLVLNSDILLQASDVETMLQHMETNPDIVAMMPHVVGPDGRYQGLCRTLPSPWDLFRRRFLHQHSRNVIAESDIPADGLNIPYLSGCFMLLRMEAVRRVGYFDERFFLYPEDVDLSRRLHAIGRTLYWPQVTIVHNHAQASYKSLRMMLVHAWQMCKYYNKWGWHNF